MLPIDNRNALGRGGACVLAMLALARPESVAQATEAPGPAPGGPATQPSAEAQQIAHIVLIGEVGSDPELAALLRELLGRQSIAAAIEHALRFEQDALFADQERGTLGIFIAQKSTHEARLYFRAPGGERYLVRELTLPSGLDAVGRELVGQVVASSAEALSASSEGLSREQASAAIASESAREPEARVKSRAAATQAPPKAELPRTAPAAAAPIEGARWEIRALGHYSVAWTGADLGLRHGPGLAFGARFGHGAFVGGALGFDYFLEQSFESPSLDGHLDAVHFHGLLETGARLSPASTVSVAVGPRLEISHFRPEAKSADVTPIDAESRTLGGIRLEAGYHWSAPYFVVGLSAIADVAFVRTHYDLLEPDGSTTTVASAWPFRPGIMLSIGTRRAY